MKYGVPVHVRSSFSDAPGTWVVGEEKSLEDVVVAGVAYDKGEAKVLLHSVMDKPGVVAKIFGGLAEKNISVDMIIQNTSTADTASTDVTFTVAKTDLARRIVVMEAVLGQVFLATALARLVSLYRAKPRPDEDAGAEGAPPT